MSMGGDSLAITSTRRFNDVCRGAQNAFRLEAKVGHEVSAFVSDRIGTFRALERGSGLLVTERRGFLVIRLGRVRILRPASPALGKCAHTLQRPGMALGGRLFEQAPRGSIVLRPADA